MSGPDAVQWMQASSQEFIRLIEDTQSMRFIDAEDKPSYRSASYYNPQVRIKAKEGILVRRVRGTVGGDRIDYPGEVAANAAEMTAIKGLLNDIVSSGARHATTDIVDFYLGTPLLRKEYMRINLSQIPEDIRLRYNLEELAVQDSYVMVEISKGMYGLPQAGILAQQRLIKLLAEHGYQQAKNTPCLFRHATRDITFTLVVDDFLIKYHRKEDAEHLHEVLRKQYAITTDWTGSKYVGITLAYDPTAAERKMVLSMPKYVANALKRFGVPQPTRNTNSPLHFVAPDYGAHVQSPTPDDDSPALSPARAKRLQEIIGVFLYYARAVDPSMLTVVSKLGSMQAHPTVAVEAMAERLMQYAACWPDARITYVPSDMQLAGQADASYLSETGSRSRAGGVLYTSSTGINGSIECISTIIPTVVASAAEAEYAALFIVGQAAEGLRNLLEDLGHPQNPTAIICDNSCAVGIANSTVKQKRSKAIAMRYHWIRDRVQQGHFLITWQAGKTNLADFFTKLHPVRHHLEVRNSFVSYPPAPPRVPNARSRRTAAHQASLAVCRGCVDGEHHCFSQTARSPGQISRSPDLDPCIICGKTSSSGTDHCWAAQPRRLHLLCTSSEQPQLVE
jgi:hypothetical protein